MLDYAHYGHARPPSHPDVLGRITNVDATSRLHPELLDSKLKLKRMRFAMWHTIAEHSHGKQRL